MTTPQVAVEIVARVDEFQKAIEGVQGKLEAAGERMTSVGKTLSKNVSAPIAAVGTALAATAVKTGQYADKLLDLEQQTGLSTTALQEYRMVAGEAGVAQDTIANAAIRLTTRLSAVGEESAATQAAFAKLGVESRNTDGSLRSMDDLLPEIISGLQGMEDITERNALATEFFGRGASELAPVLGLTAEQTDRAREAAHELGLVMERDALESANEFRKQLDQLRAQMGGVVREIGTAVIPIMSRLVGVLSENVIPVVLRLVDFFGSIPAPIQTIIGVVGALVAALGPLLVVLGTVASAISSLLPIFAAVAAVMSGPLLVPIGLVVAALGALWLAWEGLKRVGPLVADMVGTVVQLFRGPLEAALTAVLAPIRAVEGAFGWLYDRVVGNSHVPDMVDGIAFEMGRLDSVMVQPAERATQAVDNAFRQMAVGVRNSMAQVTEAASGMGGGGSSFGGPATEGAQVNLLAEAMGIRLAGQAGERQRQFQEARGVAQAQQTGWAFAGSGAGMGERDSGRGGVAWTGPMPQQQAPPLIFNIGGGIALPNVTDRSNAADLLDELVREAERRARAGQGNPFMRLREG